MEKVKIATHNGTFHADDVFAIAVLDLYFKKLNQEIEVIRTRDLKIIASCDIVVDVGGSYNPNKKIYDHHQKEKPENRKNGIPLASFGLVWKHYGKDLVSTEKAWQLVEQKLVMPIDALDNGVTISSTIHENLYEYTISHVLSAIDKTYGEDGLEASFAKALELAGLIVSGEIIKAEKKIQDEEEIGKQILSQNIPEILTLEKYLSWESTASKHPNIKFVIFPDKTPDRWCIQTVRDNPEVFGGDRVKFPEHWCSLTDQALIEASGVEDTVFCHAAGFFAVAKTREAAMKLATLAINYPIVG